VLTAPAAAALLSEPMRRRDELNLRFNLFLVARIKAVR
jgi:hypothetical protein